MAVQWPLALPQKPLQDGYKRTIPNNLIRSSMDTGSDKVRRRGRFKPQVVTASYLLRPNYVYQGQRFDQKAVLEQFVHNSIAEGAVAFNFPHPETGSLVRARLKATSDGLFDISQYKDTLCWVVTLTFEIWPDVKA